MMTLALWWSMIWRLVSLLLLMAGGAYAVWYLSRKSGLSLTPRTNGPVQVLARHYLGGKNYLCFVQIPEKVLILGMCEGQMSLISEMPLSAWPEQAAERGFVGNFADVLKARLS